MFQKTPRSQSAQNTYSHADDNPVPELLEPLLFYILHRANAVIRDRAVASVFKAFFIDEAWVFLKTPASSGTCARQRTLTLTI
jgi:type IV secretory pathway VirB4 component